MGVVIKEKEEQAKPLLIVGIFFWDTLNGEFFARCLGIINHLFHMSQRKDNPISFKVCSFFHKSRAQAKTELVEEALATSATWVMFLDDKVFVNNNVFESIIDVSDCAITSVTNVPDKDVMIELHCAVIKTSAFEKITKPYFLRLEKDGKWISENVFFLEKAKRKGVIAIGIDGHQSLRLQAERKSGEPSQIITEKHSKTDVLIAIPVAETVPGQFFSQFLVVLHSLFNKSISDGFGFAVQTIWGKEIDQSRTETVDEAMRLHAKEILWLDSDSIVEADLIHKMISREEDVVSAVTVKKSAPYSPVVLRMNDGYLNFQEDFQQGKGLIEVDAVGLGCTVTKTDVFRKIGKHYFKITKMDMPDGSVDWEGEDVYMSGKMKSAGYKLWVDTDLCYGHLGKIATVQDYNAFYRESMMYLRTCRDKAVKSLIGFWKNKYTGKEIKALFMQMKKQIKEVDETYLTPEEWLAERADWHLWGEQWERDQNVTAQIINLQRKYGNIAVLCLDRGIGQLPSMLTDLGIEIDCLALPEDMAIIKDIHNFWIHRKLNIVELKSLTKNYYDVIVAIDWFEHLDEKEFDSTIAILRKIVKQGSELIVTSAPHNDRHRHYQWTEERKQAVLNIKKGVTG
ncbi:hypothetical protein KKC52_12650 [bacterium]|nr:hypothetical protein [bacterium]